MFDKLVESTPHKQRGRAGRFFFVTGLVYGAALVALATLTIFWFNPSLAEAYVETTRIVPAPPVLGPSLPASIARLNHGLATTNTAVINQPIVRESISADVPVTAIPTDTRREVMLGSGGHSGDRVPGAPETGLGDGLARATTPPPPPPPATPTPAPPSEARRVSEGVLQGSAVKRVTPVYPAIARQVRAAGVVQVQVTISEQGRVIEAAVVSGHPLLRDAALQAARQWVFQPTTLSRVPVTVQGILSFNFTLN